MTSILGEHGEGYCTVCHFVEPLTPEGKIQLHYRGQGLSSWNGDPKPCKGSHKTPPKTTPATSRKAAFKTTAPTGTCGTCGKQGIAVRYFGTDSESLDQHTNGVKMCPGAYRRPAGR